MAKTYKATIVPIVSDDNVEVKVSANSVTQAIGIIRTLSYFNSLIGNPKQVNEDEENHLTKISNLIKKANAKKQVELASIM